jgi:hypothetical protein
MSVGHVRLRDAQASLGTPPPVGPLESAPPHRRSIAGTPKAPGGTRTLAAGTIDSGQEANSTRSGPAGDRRAGASQRSRTGTLPPGLATRNPGGPIRPKPGEHGRFCAPNSLVHRLTEVMNRQNTQLSQRACNTPITVQRPMATMPEEMPMQRARARAAIATVNFADRPLASAYAGDPCGEAAGADRAGRHCQCTALITCKTDTAASHIAGLDVPYRVIRQAGSPQATNQARQPVRTSDRVGVTLGRSDGEDGVEWRVVMPLGGEANARM